MHPVPSVQQGIDAYQYPVLFELLNNITTPIISGNTNNTGRKERNKLKQ